MSTNYVVYALTNTVNGKQYIGASKNPDNRRHKHLSGLANRLIKEDIAEFGKDAFSFEVLARNMTEAQAHTLETKLCLEVNPAYNLTEDGKHGRFAKGENNPKKRPELRAKQIGENNPAKRPEVRKKIGDAHRGKTLSPANIQGIIKRNTGRTPHNALSQQKIDHIRYLRRNGLAIKHIMTICEVSKNTISKHTKDLRHYNRKGGDQTKQRSSPSKS